MLEYQDPNASSPGQDPANVSGVTQSDLGQAAGSPGSEAVAPVSQAFDPKAYELKVNGQNYYPKDQNHLRELAMKGYDYSQRMEKHNKAVEQFQQQQAKYKKFEDLQNALESDPDFSQYYFDSISKYKKGAPVDDGVVVSPEIKALRDELGGTKKQVEELAKFKEEAARRNMDEAIGREIKDLRDKYKDQNWDLDTGDGTLEKRVLKHAYDGEFKTLNAAFRDLMFDTVATTSREDALKKAKNDAIEKSRQGIVSNGNGAAPVAAKPPQRFKSYNAAKESALQELGLRK